MPGKPVGRPDKPVKGLRNLVVRHQGSPVVVHPDIPGAVRLGSLVVRSQVGILDLEVEEVHNLGHPVQTERGGIDIY